MLLLQNRKVLLVMLLSFMACAATAQQGVPTRYYDSSWQKTSKESAFYYMDIVKNGTVYDCTAYWMRSKKIKSIGSYADTNFAKPVGLNKGYYENGPIEDSSFYHENGKLKEVWHFYPDGKLFVHASYDLKTDKEKTEAYDEAGKTIGNFIYMREASFRDPAAWREFLAENIKTNTPVKKGADVGTYQVIVRFIVGIDGSVEDVVAETNHGFGMEAEVIRVLKQSPKWAPAIQLGKAVKAYRRQPITFVVEGRGKKSKG